MASPTPRSRMPKGTAMIVTGVAGVIAGIVLFTVVANLIRTTGSPSSLSTATFDVGPAKQRAGTIAEGGPILFQDLLGGSRDIFVQHLGGDDWRAFDAHAPGAARSCFLTWNAGTREFIDLCSSTRFPADGTGLTAYKTEVSAKGRVLVDLRSPVPVTTTTIVASTTTPAAPVG